eukprot:m.268334 g.268334  ORF g.268334 m.268334 type:complete len:55 (-) comp78016_c0_seq1:124-288(-)
MELIKAEGCVPICPGWDYFTKSCDVGMWGRCCLGVDWYSQPTAKHPILYVRMLG